MIVLVESRTNSTVVSEERTFCVRTVIIWDKFLPPRRLKIWTYCCWYLLHMLREWRNRWSHHRSNSLWIFEWNTELRCWSLSVVLGNLKTASGPIYHCKEAFLRRYPSCLRKAWWRCWRMLGCYILIETDLALRPFDLFGLLLQEIDRIPTGQRRR